MKLCKSQNNVCLKLQIEILNIEAFISRNHNVKSVSH